MSNDGDDYDDELAAVEDQPMTLPEKHAALAKAEGFLRGAVKHFGVSPETRIELRRNGRSEGQTTIRKAVDIAKRSRA